MKVENKDKDLALVVALDKFELFMENSKKYTMKKSLTRVEKKLNLLKKKER